MRIRIFRHPDGTRTYAVVKARTKVPFTPIVVRGPPGTALEGFKGVIHEVKELEAAGRKG